MTSQMRPRPMLTARARLLAIGIAAASLLAALLLPAQGADAGAAQGVEAKKRKNGIVFKTETSQGIEGRITYLKRYEGEGRNFVQLETEILLNCVGSSGSYTERQNMILQGHSKGRRFSAEYHPQNTETDQFRQTASVKFKPRGRRKRDRLPRWRKAKGTVQAMRSINDPFVQVQCDSGPVSIKSTSFRRERFGPRPSIIVVV